MFIMRIKNIDYLIQGAVTAKMATLRNHHLDINTGHFNISSHSYLHLLQQLTQILPTTNIHKSSQNGSLLSAGSPCSIGKPGRPSIRLIIILINDNNSGMKFSSNISFFYSGTKFTNKLTKYLPGWLSLSLINRCQVWLLQA